jgi:N-acetylated-alpha-linked acidic dipeptidase
MKASRIYASLPRLAGSEQDLVTAKVVLKSFPRKLNESFGVKPPSEVSLYPAGSEESRSATLNTPSTTEPLAWIDTYYPILNRPGNSSLEIIDENVAVIWSADLEEDGDCLG